MKRLFIAVTVASLATILVPVSARASNLAFDPAGNLFWANGPSVFKYTSDGAKSTFAAGLKGPLSLCFDSKGDLFVSDLGSHSILKFTPDGKESTFASGLKPYEMAFDDKGNLFVADRDSESIFKFTPDREKSTFAGGVACYDGLAFDNSGNLFVCNNSNSIFKFTPDGTKSTFASGLSSPWGLAVDGAGNLFVAEQDSHSILKFSPDGSKSTFASELRPFDVAVDRLGNLFVWDAESKSILKFTPEGTKSTFARSSSPDQKWEYNKDDDPPKIVKAGTNEVALELNGIGGLDWAPDSKRFACYSGGGGRSHTIFLYQLRGDEWKELQEPIDAVYETLNKAIAAQIKKRGLPKKTDLRLIWETVELDRWVDSNTAIVYAGRRAVVRENVDEGFGADFLLTLKLDEAGHCKIVKTHRMSERELEKREKGE